MNTRKRLSLHQSMVFSIIAIPHIAIGPATEMLTCFSAIEWPSLVAAIVTCQVPPL